MKNTVAIIGAGKMGQAVARGLLDKKIIKPDQLTLTNPTTSHLESFEKKGVFTTSSNKEAVEKSHVVILAVKPQDIKSVLSELADAIRRDQVIISIAAGVSISRVQKIIGKKPVVRVMPNLCAQIGESISAWVKSPEVTPDQEQTALSILKAIGQETQLKNEDDLNAVTAISGSGPAYFFHIAHVLEQTALDLGLSKKVASDLVRQTFIGSALLIKNSDSSFQELVTSVTSKGGTTASALQSWSESKVDEGISQGVQAAARRAKELNIK